MNIQESIDNDGDNSHGDNDDGDNDDGSHGDDAEFIDYARGEGELSSSSEDEDDDNKLEDVDNNEVSLYKLISKITKLL